MLGGNMGKKKRWLKDQHVNAVTCQNKNCKAYNDGKLADIQRFGYQDKEKRIQWYRCKICGKTMRRGDG